MVEDISREKRMESRVSRSIAFLPFLAMIAKRQQFWCRRRPAAVLLFLAPSANKRRIIHQQNPNKDSPFYDHRQLRCNKTLSIFTNYYFHFVHFVSIFFLFLGFLRPTTLLHSCPRKRALPRSHLPHQGPFHPPRRPPVSRNPK